MRFLGSCAGEGPARQTEAAESDVVFGRHGGPSMIARNASRETLSAGGGASMSLFESTLRRWGPIVRVLPTLGIYVKLMVYLEF